MPVSTSALAKILGLQIMAGILAVTLGFLVLWPKTMAEGLARLLCTLLASSLFGPVILVHLYHQYPLLFESAQALAALYGIDPALGLLFVATPALVIAGLPAWWMIGALLRMFEKDSDGLLGAVGGFVKRKLGGHS